MAVPLQVPAWVEYRHDMNSIDLANVYTIFFGLIYLVKLLMLFCLASPFLYSNLQRIGLLASGASVGALAYWHFAGSKKHGLRCLING